MIFFTWDAGIAKLALIPVRKNGDVRFACAYARLNATNKNSFRRVWRQMLEICTHLPLIIIGLYNSFVIYLRRYEAIR